MKLPANQVGISTAEDEQKGMNIVRWDRNWVPVNFKRINK